LAKGKSAKDQLYPPGTFARSLLAEPRRQGGSDPTPKNFPPR